ncbi:poly-beta-1,6-N-acetyl-D-glucosamine biosynthesis protein PgaD [Achromobacter deleyi]|uniref:poly-beta-1,6-N-acetyl-D-glucosamine biosynthesis protein PgaD n=1 Tax=Achromobacter deleyi TaxID=1353891 RepID=UPI001468BBA6|nr:poly-beta-1,6-N-acetyl-D-glucosamine biosynthesis protein PgaD [Achromobacter deleyi]CAB3921619.1 Biofilm PGA synthesis protein PgaD [Achromobacter deleyi]
MIITTQRSRAGYLFDLLLTAVGWFAFVYLFGSGIAAILRGAASGPQAPLWPTFLPTLHTLAGYALLALANAAVLVAWAVYNHLRFRGKDRRQPIDALNDHQLAMSFAVTPQQLAQLRGARVAVIHHSGDGEIRGIEAPRPRLAAVAGAAA